jgi:glycosyltransferase involved in cell wall biosynthesis
VLTGFVYDKDMLTELWCNCYAYVHGNEVGGTNPALLQAMASGSFVISLDVPFNREVLGEAGIYFAKDAPSLADKLEWSLGHAADLADFRAQAVERIKERYCWDTVAGRYEAMFHELVDGKYPQAVRNREKEIASYP